MRQLSIGNRGSAIGCSLTSVQRQVAACINGPRGVNGRLWYLTVAYAQRPNGRRVTSHRHDRHLVNLRKRYDHFNATNVSMTPMTSRLPSAVIRPPATPSQTPRHMQLT